MYKSNHSPLHFHRVLVVLLATLALTLSCSKPVPRPTGPAADYQDAKDMFKRLRFDRALEFTDGLATASPVTKFTERARVLRAVILQARSRAIRSWPTPTRKEPSRPRTHISKPSTGACATITCKTG